MNIVKLTIALLCLAALAGCARKAKIDAVPPVSTGTPAAATETVVVEPAAPAPVAEAPVQEPLGLFSGDERMGAIYFDFDSYTLSGEAREQLERNARVLRDDPAARITIEGHTDERGADAYNLALGDKRARAALAYLQKLGIADNRMRAVSYGEERPAVSGQAEEAWAKNRRAEFVR